MNDTFACPVGQGPLMERAPRRPIGPVAAYALSAALAGGLVGAATSALGRWVSESLASPGWLATVVAAMALSAYAVALERQQRVGPLPQARRQVPRAWREWRSKSRAAAAFGAAIGGGVFTYLHHASAYVLGIALFLSADPRVGAATGAIYGGMRGAALLEAWWRRERPDAMTVRADRRARTAAAGLAYVAPASAVLAIVVATASAAQGGL